MESPLILNRYRPLEEAGSGGFATVQVAWDTRIQRKVAIKCIPLALYGDLPAPDSLGDPNAMGAGAAAADYADALGGFPAETDDPYANLDERLHRSEQAALARVADIALLEGQSANPAEGAFANPEGHWMSHVPGLDEARTAALLQDENIVTVFDFEIQGGMAYLIMEYVEGMTLTELLRDHDADISLDLIAAVFGDIAHALTKAHRNGVLHLDIKPDNVLISVDGKVKVTDFGLATLTDAQGFGTAGGGTIGYMPLEQMRQESLDARCDQWALASIAYEMIAGKNPFVVPSLQEAEAAIEDAELVLPSLCWNDLDPVIDDVVFQALDPDRDERYKSVAAFAGELMPLLGDPDEGHAELKLIVGGDADPMEIDYEEPEVPRIPLSERLGPNFFPRISHLISCLATVVVGLVACVNLPVIQGYAIGGWTSLPMWGIVAVLGILGAWKEHLGVLLGFCVLGVSLILNGAYLPGAVLIVATAAWWWFIGRHNAIFANCALAFPLLGSVGLAPVAVLVSGYCLVLFDALFTTILGAIVCVVMAGFGSASLLGWNVFANWQFASVDVTANILSILGDPITWLLIASWILAALAMSLCSSRAKRWQRIVGALVGCVIMVAAACAGAFIASDAGSWVPKFAVLAPIIASGAIMVVACAVQPIVKPQSDIIDFDDSL